jgi:predicted dienelactone hydrolase
MSVLRILGLLVLAIVLSLALVFVARAPEPPPAASESARRLAPGPLPVGSADYTFVDRSRPTAANGDFAGAPQRTLEATLWYPDGDSGRHPLLVYSHGFMSWRTENAPLAELLASHGYVVVAVDFPLTTLRAPGGPNAADVVNQPGDLSFVMDEMLGWDEAERPFDGSIDPERIGTLGVSLGGLTTILVTYHPRLRDPRIRAALSIAGIAEFFDERFYANAAPPFLMLAGSADALVAYETNALPIPRRVALGALLTIENGTHTGFTAISDRFPNRLLSQPDGIGCLVLNRNLDSSSDARADSFALIGGPEDGLVFNGEWERPCKDGLPDAPLSPGRQLMITRLAALAFFGSQLAPDPAERAAHATFLRETLAKDFPEARYEDAQLGSEAVL